jgi:uncharacterized protein (TIGR02302 family)
MPMIIPPRPQDSVEPLLRGVRRRRRLALAALLIERGWPALWPAVGVAGLFLCAALLDLPRALPPALHAALLVVVAIAVVVLAGRGLTRLRLPDAAEADRRLERASGLDHRPLAVLTDRPVSTDPMAAALWTAHLGRTIARVGRLAVGRPRPGMPARDPRALRLGLLVALIACLGVAGDQAPGRIARSLVPLFAPPAGPASMQVQAWITPPAFTGLPPVFLHADGGAATVPAGSHLAVSLTGGAGEPRLSLAGTALPFRRLDAASFEADADLTAGGRLVLGRGGADLAAWDLTVVADQPPVVGFPEPPGATRGRIPEVRLPWQVSHAYGVVGLQAELHLRDRPDLPALIVTVPLPGGAPKAAHGVRQQDLTAHPWAGLGVTARLVGRDGAGLVGTSADASFTLPERAFQHPVARALMAVRRMLTLKPEDRAAAVLELDRLAGLDAVWAGDLAGFLNLRDITALLRHDPAPTAVDEAQAAMWQLALHLEEGAPERTARALEAARQALREMLDAQQRGDKVDQAELDQRLRAVQEALQRYLQALTDQARREPGTEAFDPEANRLDMRDMQRLAEQMRQAAEAGRPDEARQKLSELERMLDELKNARIGHMTERQRQRAEKRQRGQQQMNALQDMVQREVGLLDHAQERAGGAARRDDPRLRFFPPVQPPPPPRPPADAARDHAARDQDGAVQRALRRALGELMQEHGDLTGKIPPNLSEADTAMRDAMTALGAGRDAPAATAEQRAVEALQQGGRSMGQQMASQFGFGQQDEGDEGEDEYGEDNGQGSGGQDGLSPDGSWGQGQQDGSRGWGHGRNPDRRADRDPLGRAMPDDTEGADQGSDVQVPDKMEAARSRAIQEELRRRDADRTRPQFELDYIERLLRQF